MSPTMSPDTNPVPQPARTEEPVLDMSDNDPKNGISQTQSLQASISERSRRAEAFSSHHGFQFAMPTGPRERRKFPPGYNPYGNIDMEIDSDDEKTIALLKAAKEEATQEKAAREEKATTHVPTQVEPVSLTRDKSLVWADEETDLQETIPLATKASSTVREWNHFATAETEKQRAAAKRKREELNKNTPVKALKADETWRQVKVDGKGK